MDAQNGTLSLKERMLQYQENAKKNKEYDRKHSLEISQLDSTMTDVSRFSRASSLANRKATTVSADMVNRLDPNLLEDFSASTSLNASAGSLSFLQSPVRRFQSPVTSGLKMDDESDVRGLFLRSLVDSSSGDVKRIEEVQKGTFSDLRSKYLRSIFSLMPIDGEISHMTKKERLCVFRDDAHKRDEYVNIRDAWDVYEQKAHDRPYEPTMEDKKVETEIKSTETNISTQWTNLAKQVIDDILDGEGETEVEEEEDEDLLATVEAARHMAKENKLRQRNKQTIEMKRQTQYWEEKLKDEDPELLKEALLLKDESTTRNESSFPLSFSQEEMSEKSEWDSLWKEEARRQRLADQSRKDVDKAKTHKGHDDGSDEDDHVIGQGRKLRRAYIRHLSSQKDSDSESDEDDEVNNIPKWIGEARELLNLSGSISRALISGSKSSFVNDISKSVDEKGRESDTDDEEGRATHNSEKFNKTSSSSSDYEESDDSSSVYLWREEARRMKEERRAKEGKKDEEFRAGDKNKTEVSESSFYEDVVRKAMELEKKYSQRRAMLDNEDSSSSSEDGVDRSLWLNEARKLKARGRYKVDDPEKQAWLDEAKRCREADESKGETQVDHSYSTGDGDSDDEKITLNALKLCRDDKKATNQSAASTYSEEERSKWVQEARKHETRKKKIFGSESSVWMDEARRRRTEALAKKAAEQGPGELILENKFEQPESSKDTDAEVIETAKSLRREFIRERLKFGYMTGSDDDNDDVDVDDLSRWIEAARAARERKSKTKSEEHPAHSSKKKWYEDSEADSSDENVDEAKKSVFLEEAKRLRALSNAKGADDLPGRRESGSQPAKEDPDKEIRGGHAGIYDDVIKKAMALEKKYMERRAAKKTNQHELDDSETPGPSRWIQEAQSIEAEFTRRQSSKKTKKRSKKKKEEKSRKVSIETMDLKAPPLPDQTVRSRRDDDGPNPEILKAAKEVGSNRPTSQWIIEARKRKEKGLLALRAAKEEVRTRQRVSLQGLSLSEKKKLRMARLQEAIERREAEGKRDLEEKRKEAESIKLAMKKKSKESKKKAFYSDSSGSESFDEDTANDEKSIVVGEGPTHNKRRKEKRSKKERSRETSSLKPSASTSSKKHRHRNKANKANDNDDDSDRESETNRKQSYSSYKYSSSSSESSFSEDSSDEDNEAAYIVQTDPSSSETVHSDSSDEEAHVKGGAVVERAAKKKISKNAVEKSADNKADGKELMSPSIREKAKELKSRSPRKTKKTGDEPTKSKTIEEVFKSPTIKSPKKTKSTQGDAKAAKSPRKSNKV